jgi:RND family efflux transporter MFP subunit
MKPVLLWLIPALLLAGGIVYEATRPAPGAAAAAIPSVLVTAQKLTLGTLPDVVTAYGSIQPGPGAERLIAPPAGGSLASLAVAAGQRVAAGAQLATLVPDAASLADAERAASALAAAKTNFSRVSALLAAHLATNADLAAARQTMRDAQAASAALRATGAGTVRTLAAPFAGIITAVLATPGSAFGPGTPLLRMVASAGLVATAGLPPAQAANLRTGAAATLQMLDTGAKIPAHVTAIPTMLDPQTGLLPLQLTADAPFAAALNEPVSAEIIAQTLSGYILPRDAVQSDVQGDFIYQVDARRLAHRIAVKVLGKADTQTIIAANIDARLPVVVSGTAQLADGMTVRTAP